jgi:hypothetical protein
VRTSPEVVKIAQVNLHTFRAAPVILVVWAWAIIAPTSPFNAPQTGVCRREFGEVVDAAELCWNVLRLLSRDKTVCVCANPNFAWFQFVIRDPL